MKKVKSSKNRAVATGKRVIKRADKWIEIYGVPLFGTQLSTVISKIWLQRKEMLHVATVNSEYIMEARHSEKFRNILGKCLTVADGYGVIWAVKILNHKFSNSPIERITGVQLAEKILERADQKGEKIFLLGAAEGVAQKAAQAMRARYPGAKIAWFEGAKTVKVEKSEEASMTIAKINGFEPDYLLVAYGSPAQDLWIEENRPYLRARVAIGVGGVLDEWAGVVKKCPTWIDQLGFKWLWRVSHEPWRWKRILRVLQFGILVLYQKLID